MQIDARGKGCPIPVIMTEEALSKIGEGIIDVLVDNEESALNVSGYAAQNGMFAETTREGKDWKIKVVKGYSCKTGVKPGVAGAESAKNKKTLLLIIGTDSLGKDEDLGTAHQGVLRYHESLQAASAHYIFSERRRQADHAE